jgi:hypothetical protein
MTPLTRHGATVIVILGILSAGDKGIAGREPSADRRNCAAVWRSISGSAALLEALINATMAG